MNKECTNLSLEEMKMIRGGVAPALATVIAVGAIAIIVVTVYKLYKSTKGGVNLGTGIKFEWEIKWVIK